MRVWQGLAVVEQQIHAVYPVGIVALFQGAVFNGQHTIHVQNKMRKRSGFAFKHLLTMPHYVRLFGVTKQAVNLPRL